MRTSADCRPVRSPAARSSASWPPRLSWISPAARARSASMKAMSPNSAPSASNAASTSRSSSLSPASIAARNTVPPASISRITIAMSDRSSSACSSRAPRTSLTARLISPLQASDQVRRGVLGRRTGAAGRVLEQVGQGVGTDRDEHAHPGRAGSRAIGVSQGRPERRRAQPRQHGLGADAAQVVTAALRHPQQPGPDTRLEALNLLKVTHQAPPYTCVTPQDGRSLAGGLLPGDILPRCVRIVPWLAIGAAE